MTSPDVPAALRPVDNSILPPAVAVVEAPAETATLAPRMPLPTNNDKLPAEPPDDEPVPIITAPEPVAAEPVAKVMAPLEANEEAPVSMESGPELSAEAPEDTETEPLLPLIEAPDETWSPPLIPLLVMPDWSVSSPLPASPVPEATTTPPLVPADASPDVTATSPLAPVLALPVAKVADPEVEPEADSRLNWPERPAELDPVAIEMSPPATRAEPAVTMTSAPDEVLLPPRMVMSPAEP